MFKYILIGKLVQSIKNEEFSQFDQLIILLLFTVIKGGFSFLGSLLGCPEATWSSFVLILVMAISLVLAFVANGGRTGNNFAMKYVSLGTLLAMWLYAICWVGVYLAAEVTYNFLHQGALTQSIHANYWGIHSLSFSVLYLGATWWYFSKFRSE
jgi:hypothetical protein